jgi:hypothetical protein
LIFYDNFLPKNKSSVQEGVAPIIFKKRAPRKPIPSSGNIEFLLGVAFRRRKVDPASERRFDVGTAFRRRNATPKRRFDTKTRRRNGINRGAGSN